MPASFIALQCFECSTMQVKQQKKSSNKWICVVCNQKQSVRKVFAHASMAKDVRKFVQNFNMSRQLADQKLNLSDALETSDSPPKDEQKRKRSDWTEYVDDQDECFGKFDKDVDPAEGDEAMVVTEMPKALFKKPKVKDYSSNRNGSGKLMKPQFPNRSSAKNVHSQEWTAVEQTSLQMISKDSSHKEPVSVSQSEHASKPNGINGVVKEQIVRLHHSKGAVSKWSSFITDDDDDNDDLVTRAVCLQHKKGPVSKWSSFITDEDDNDDFSSRGIRDSQSNHPLELLTNDQRVEDDTHPDFL